MPPGSNRPPLFAGLPNGQKSCDAPHPPTQKYAASGVLRSAPASVNPVALFSWESPKKRIDSSWAPTDHQGRIVRLVRVRNRPGEQQVTRVEIPGDRPASALRFTLRHWFCPPPAAFHS